MIRNKLKKGPKAFATNDIKALWCMLDADSSNEIHKEEASAFFKAGMKNSPKPKGPLVKDATSQNLVSSIERYNMNVAIASQPTAEMRAELEKEGVTFPDDAKLLEHSVKLNEWIEEYRYKEHKGDTYTWFNLFAEVDKDGSGVRCSRLTVR